MLKVSMLTWTSVSAAYWEKNKDRGLDHCPISDLDMDMDVWHAFEVWIRGGDWEVDDPDRLKVEYVKE